MECFWGGGGSSKHWYTKHQTFFSRRVSYVCARCWSTISEKDYILWVKMHQERDKLLEEYMKRRIET